jgi:hypothetical protein
MPGAGRVAVDSAEHWRAVRRELNQHRHQLTQAANRLYPGVLRVGTTELLSRPEWIPDWPLELGEVILNWFERPLAPAVDGSEPASEGVRPLRPDSSHYPAYAEALADLGPPALFDNRASYRLLAADLTPGPSHVDLTLGRYFDGVNIGEALAHELSAAWMPGPATMDSLPFRSLVGDPCDLSRRSAIPAITTLTIRRAPGGEASFLMHWRDPAKVTHAGGLRQVIPVGIFQPADNSPASVRNDLSLWRSMVREFSEELLGTSEDYRDLGSPIGYDYWPFYRELSAARAAGSLRVFCLGLGVDPLTLAVDLLTVAVFASEVFDVLFGRLVAANAEGRVMGGADGAAGAPFTGETVARFAGGGEPMQPAGAAVLQLAWRHRDSLLN